MTKTLIFIMVFLFSQVRAQEPLACENKNMFITKLSHICEYPIKLQEKNQEAFVAIEYQTNGKGFAIKRKIVMCDNKRFRKAALRAFDKMRNVQIETEEKRDTLYFQYKIQGSQTPIHPLTDIKIIGYGSCDKPVLMK